jgi:hypothetical protein
LSSINNCQSRIVLALRDVAKGLSGLPCLPCLCYSCNILYSSVLYFELGLTPLLRHCSNHVSFIPGYVTCAQNTGHTLGLYRVPGHAGVRGIEIADKLTRDGSVQRFVGPEPFLGVSGQNIRRKMKRWLENQLLVLWPGPCSTLRQAGELMSGPDLASRAQLLSLNRTQSRVVIGLLTRHNTLRRHLYIMGLSNKPTCRKCGTKDETSVHILCECEA